jgi:hypothetical protein
MSLLSASGQFLLDFPSPRHLSSSVSYPLDLSGLGDPTGSNATAGLALRVTGTHKTLYHGKVEMPTKALDLTDADLTDFVFNGQKISVLKEKFRTCSCHKFIFIFLTDILVACIDYSIYIIIIFYSYLYKMTF